MIFLGLGVLNEHLFVHGRFNSCLWILQTGKSSRGGGGDGEHWEMDDQTRAEMEEAERDADRSW